MEDNIYYPESLAVKDLWEFLEYGFEFDGVLWWTWIYDPLEGNTKLILADELAS